jgi:hypothetical protein
MKQQVMLTAPVSLLAFLFLFCSNVSTTAITKETITIEDTAIKPTGMIAYIRDGSEIRLIDSSGGNDHRLWTHPNAREPLGLFDVAWRPDGKELAFSSAHEAVSSLYHADLYAIRPDGSGFRKITNSPDYKDFDQYKKGAVSITVRNNQYSFQTARSSEGVFIVNVVGAEKPQSIALPPGASKTLVFQMVADFGSKAQAAVAINGNQRWYMPAIDVEAGKTTKAPDFIITGNGYEYFGAFRPVWKNDGSVITYRDGVCLVKSIPSSPPVGEMYFKPLFKDTKLMGACVWDMGPTPGTANQVLYTENAGSEGSGIYLMKEGASHDPSTRLTFFADIQYQIAHDLKWLPDASGFLYSATNLMADASNIFWYDFKTKQKKQLTNLQGAFARRFCISPSGKWVVYERSKTVDDYKTVELWMISFDGRKEKLLVKNGLCPSWSK